MATTADSRGKREKTGGRKKGTPNKTTAAVKDAVMNAFKKVGGEDYLVIVAQEDPKTFCALLGRILPSEITANISIDDLADRINAGRARSTQQDGEN